MADKEERKLFFSELQKNTKDTYKLTKLGKLKGSCFPITMLWKKSMTRQEAIERMKNADIKKYWECQKEGRRPTDDERYGAMLDALLEG